MRDRARTLLLTGCGLLLLLGCGGGAQRSRAEGDAAFVPVAGVERLLADFAPVSLEPPGHLATADRAVVEELVAASRAIDAVYLRQADRYNPVRRRHLETLHGPRARAARALFDVEYGVYSERAGWQPFVEPVPPRPAGGGLYPADLDAAELDTFVRTHPDREAELISATSVVERRGDEFEGVPYSVAYASDLAVAAEHLQRAAQLAREPSLRRHLEQTALALLTDRYRAADEAWTRTRGPVGLVLGPYARDLDRLRGDKGAFEAMVMLDDPAGRRHRARFEQLLAEVAAELPAAARPAPADERPEVRVEVADLLFAAGAARRGPQTIAFSFPLDRDVRERAGARRVVIRNVIEAKARAVLQPIARRILPPEQAAEVDAQAPFELVLLHELAHGLGPYRAGDEQGRVRVEELLLDHHRPIEEAKAEVLGMRVLLAQIDAGLYPQRREPAVTGAFVAGLVRQLRVARGAPAGRSARLVWTALRAADALRIDEATQRVQVDPVRLRLGLDQLAAEILAIQQRDGHPAAARLLARHAEIDPATTALIAGLDDLPVDIRVSFPKWGDSVRPAPPAPSAPRTAAPGAPRRRPPGAASPPAGPAGPASP
jgi:hypothetical protein